jgi:hypothetical protein
MRQEKIKAEKAKKSREKQKSRPIIKWAVLGDPGPEVRY